MLARSEGARVVVAGRDSEALAAGYDGEDISAETVDVTDDESISAFAARVGPVDHLVSTVSARARGKLADLDRVKLQLSFDTKVIGPAMLAKHFAPQINEGGSIVLFSGVNAFKVNVGYLSVAITNGAVDFLTRSLAVELAPIRVNAISPGVIDTGAWDSLGEDGKRRLLCPYQRHQPCPPDRHRRRRRRGGAVRAHQHIPDRGDPEGRRW
jgi:NAD(P)-dependent dehydrogenase (short-subunit alcohol dehydrogenase family)